MLREVSRLPARQDLNAGQGTTRVRKAIGFLVRRCWIAVYLDSDFSPTEVQESADGSIVTVTALGRYDLDLKGCLFGLQRAIGLGWFQLMTSMVEDREHLAKNLNMQLLIPNVYVFNSPVSGDFMHSFYEDAFTGGGRLYGPDKYIETLYVKNITMVVHVDPPTYDTNIFSGPQDIQPNSPCAILVDVEWRAFGSAQLL
jgi:hypothetical protein